MTTLRSFFYTFILLVLFQILVLSQDLKIGISFVIEYSNKMGKIDNEETIIENKVGNFVQELFKYLRIIGKKNSIDFVENSNNNNDIDNNIYTNFIIYLQYDNSNDSIVIKCFQDKELIFEASSKMSSNSAMERLLEELSIKMLERISIIRLRFDDFEGMLRLTFNKSIDEYPCFSNDGSMLAFVSDRDNGNRDIYILDLNEMYIKRDNLPESSEYFPRISLDNSKIIFQSTRGGKWNIWIQRIDELSNVEDLKRVPVSRNAYTPSCNKEGVYFVQEEDDNTDIFFYDFSSEKVIKILESDEEEFSPVSSKLGIVFVRVKDDGDSGIYLLTKTGKIKTLEDSPFNEFDPIMTSDHEWLIFSSNRDGVYRLWLKNLNSNVIYKLTSQKDGDAFYPTIHGNTVVFSMYSKDEPDLWAVSIKKYKNIEKRKHELINKIAEIVELIRN